MPSSPNLKTISLSNMLIAFFIIAFLLDGGA